MSRPFIRGETLPASPLLTVKLGVSGTPYKDTELGKFVKPGTLESQFVLCAVGDLFDGKIGSIDNATAAGFSVGGIQRDDPMFVTFDGSQAAGTGVLAVGDYVVAGTPSALGTALPNVPARVRKATVQPGTTVPADFAAVAAQMAMMPYLWRVCSLGSAGSGAVGTVGMIERAIGS